MFSLDKAVSAIVAILAAFICCSCAQEEGSPCTMKTGERGICTLRPKCKSIDDALKRREFPFDNIIRCSFYKGTIVICCSDNVDPQTPDPIANITIQDEWTWDEKLLDESTTSRVPVNSQSENYEVETSDRKAAKACIQYRKDFLQIVKPFEYHIFEGEKAYSGEFPHMAALGYLEENIGKSIMKFKCGGSLISNRYVVTAAHCLRSGEGNLTVVRLGGLQLEPFSPPSKDVGIEEIIPHPQYNRPSIYHDIGLIRLNETLPLDTHLIYPACLDIGSGHINPNLNLTATGWGSTSGTEHRPSNELLKGTSIGAVNSTECYEKFVNYDDTIRSKFPNGVNGGQLCASHPELKRDTCRGDSGGPLQIILESKLSKIYGITSFGVFCGTAMPSVYARVSFYLDWLESVVWADTSTS